MTKDRFFPDRKFVFPELRPAIHPIEFLEEAAFEARVAGAADLLDFKE
jgi:hypothetical protein